MTNTGAAAKTQYTRARAHTHTRAPLFLPVAPRLYDSMATLEDALVGAGIAVLFAVLGALLLGIGPVDQLGVQHASA